MTSRRSRRPGVFRHLSSYLLAGVATAAPLLLTAYVTWSFVRWLDDVIRSFVPLPHQLERFVPTWLPGIGIMLAVLLLTALGFAAESIAGRRLIALGERLIRRLPLVRNLHLGAKQIIEALFSRPATTLQKAGLVECPRLGEWSLVLIVSEASGEIDHHLKEHVAVLLPSSHLFTGYLLWVERSELIVLDMTLEDAAKMVISWGLVMPAAPL